MNNEKDKPFSLKSIGVLSDEQCFTRIRLHEKYLPALKYLELFSHILLLFESRNEQGIRMNPVQQQYPSVASSIPHALEIQVGKILAISENSGIIIVDCPCHVDEGILFDIKPYFPCEDRVEQAHTPGSMRHWSEWYEATGRSTALEISENGPSDEAPSVTRNISKRGKIRKIDGETLLIFEQADEAFFKSLEGFSHIKILWWFERFDRNNFRRITQVSPPYENAPRTGIFATRAPTRPNPLAITTVRILDINTSRATIKVTPLDAFDNTPFIDIYPYIPAFDRVKEFSVPDWLNHWPQWLDDTLPENEYQDIPLIESGAERIKKYIDSSPQPCGDLNELISERQDNRGNIDEIRITGCRQNNLKNIDVSIPKNQLTVITGVSGSGKSSLAFDTLFAESSRRFIESMAGNGASSFGQLEKPDFDEISGLPPAVAIEQKYNGRNPRSTVGTLSDLYDYLRLLFTLIGTRHCPDCGNAISPMKEEEIFQMLACMPVGSAINLQPFGSDTQEEIWIIPEKKGAERAAFDDHLKTSLHTYLQEGNGAILVSINAQDTILLQTREMCYFCNRIFFKLSTATFSFNNPESMCPVCKGLGVKLEIDVERIVSNPERSILDGASRWWGDLRKFREKPNANWMKGEILALAADMDVDLELPWNELPASFKEQAIFGSQGKKVTLRHELTNGRKGETTRPVEGVYHIIRRLIKEHNGNTTSRLVDAFMREKPCNACHGERLSAEGRLVTIGVTRFPETSQMTLEELYHWVVSLPQTLNQTQLALALPVLQQLYKKLQDLIDAGLAYLTPDRSIPSLSGGELQRIRLACQLNSGITNILYVLDEPSSGLHARDHRKLIQLLQRLKSEGNTVLVVEHDLDTMLAADKIIDIGPGAGIHGGQIIAQGTPTELMKTYQTPTALFLRGQFSSDFEGTRKKPQDFLKIYNVCCNNLQHVDAEFPLGVLTCITGVSGSGKSSLVSKTLFPALALANGEEGINPLGTYDRLEGVEEIDHIIHITQQPIGRTPRSNPATYSGAFDLIRNLFAATPEAKARGFKQNMFSFNSKEGQCPSCSGEGKIRHDMVFMPDLWLECPLCHGKRFCKESLEISWNDASIADVLEMNIEKALRFFEGEEKITDILQTMVDVGLGYLQLGQSAVTLSGGEAQRVKLSKELSKKNNGTNIYLLDEPSTGLHTSDIHNLLKILTRITHSGHTVIVIEHKPQIIRQADWVIDLGPEGGDAGGKIIACGTPEEIARTPASHTGEILKTYFSQQMTNLV